MTVVASEYVNPKTPGTVNFLGSSGNSTLSFGFSSTIDLGREDPTRFIIVLLYVHNGALTVGSLLDSFTVNGVALTGFGNDSNGAVGTVCLGGFVPTGTTGTFTVSSSTGTGAFFMFGAWAAYNVAGIGGTPLGALARGSPRTDAQSILFRGIGVAMTNSDFGGGNFSISGDYRQDFAGSVATCGVAMGSLTKQQGCGTRAGNFNVTFTADVLQETMAITFS